jgi:DnaJ family protein C protein 7
MDVSDMFGGAGGMAGGIDPEILFSMMGQGGGFGGGFPSGAGFSFPNGGQRQRAGFSTNFHFG